MRDTLVSSKYHILINSNTHVTPENKDKLKKFVDGLKRILLSVNILNFIDIINDEDIKTPIQKLLYNIRIESTIETAPNTKYLHSHIKLTIQHFTTVDFNMRRLKKFFKHKIGMSVFAVSKLASDSSLFETRYQIKDKDRDQMRLKIISDLSPENDKVQFFSYQFR